MRLHAADLAFLSACETSRGGIELVDEAITVAAAFQLAGYRHVIGTLWSISDELAPDVARHVYQALTHDGTTGLDPGGTAAALDSAIHANREAPLLDWAPYIHLDG
jgi:CHAT domain-containing protein